MSQGVCANPACRKPLKPYRPPIRDVPTHLGRDPYCSRTCCEQHLGLRDRPHGERTK